MFYQSLTQAAGTVFYQQMPLTITILVIIQIMSTIIAVQVTFLINFAGKVTSKLFLSNKGKS